MIKDEMKTDLEDGGDTLAFGEEELVLLVDGAVGEPGLHFEPQQVLELVLPQQLLFALLAGALLRVGRAARLHQLRHLRLDVASFTFLHSNIGLSIVSHSIHISVPVGYNCLLDARWRYYGDRKSLRHRLSFAHRLASICSNI